LGGQGGILSPQNQQGHCIAPRKRMLSESHANQKERMDQRSRLRAFRMTQKCSVRVTNITLRHMYCQAARCLGLESRRRRRRRGGREWTGGKRRAPPQRMEPDSLHVCSCLFGDCLVQCPLCNSLLSGICVAQQQNSKEFREREGCCKSEAGVGGWLDDCAGGGGQPRKSSVPAMRCSLSMIFAWSRSPLTLPIFLSRWCADTLLENCILLCAQGCFLLLLALHHKESFARPEISTHDPQTSSQRAAAQYYGSSMGQGLEHVCLAFFVGVDC
jgi:hypothetical protein